MLQIAWATARYHEVASWRSQWRQPSQKGATENYSTTNVSFFMQAVLEAGVLSDADSFLVLLDHKKCYDRTLFVILWPHGFPGRCGRARASWFRDLRLRYKIRSFFAPSHQHDNGAIQGCVCVWSIMDCDTLMMVRASRQTQKAGAPLRLFMDDSSTVLQGSSQVQLSLDTCVVLISLVARSSPKKNRL